MAVEAHREHFKDLALHHANRGDCVRDPSLHTRVVLEVALGRFVSRVGSAFKRHIIHVVDWPCTSVAIGIVVNDSKRRRRGRRIDNLFNIYSDGARHVVVWHPSVTGTFVSQVG